MKKTEAQKIAQKKWRAKNKDKVRENHKRWRKSHPEHERSKSYKRRYGISIDEYNKMLLSQSGKCLICKEIEKSKNGYLYVDHCHKTLKVRGLLCLKCNTILGMAKDNPEILLKCVQYLYDNAS